MRGYQQFYHQRTTISHQWYWWCFFDCSPNEV